MKKIISVILTIGIICTISGCGIIGKNISTLKGWSFQFNEGTNDFSLFFGLEDDYGKAVSSNVDVDMRIINDAGDEVYSGRKTISESDFGYYSSPAAGERFLANVRIPKSEIAEGASSNGTVYFTVHKEGVIEFEEVNCTALYCLPVSDIELLAGPFPQTINVKGYDGRITSTIQIDDVQYSFDKSYMPVLKITIIGAKTSGTEKNSIDMISYRLYDSEGYLVDSGNVYLSSLLQGDKFKNDSIIIYDITPGESYSLSLSEYSMGY